MKVELKIKEAHTALISRQWGRSYTLLEELAGIYAYQAHPYQLETAGYYKIPACMDQPIGQLIDFINSKVK